jgi:hypothetical protein
LSDWTYWGGKQNYGYGSSPKSNAYCHCELCKERFSVDIRSKESLAFSQCAVNPENKMKKGNGGLQVTTWANCWLCGRPLHSDPAVRRGTCSEDGCAHSGRGYPSPKEKITKSNQFHALSNLHKSKKNRLPVFSHILVIVENGMMVCITADWKKDGEGIEHDSVSFTSIEGSCKICVPHETFVDVMQAIDGEEFSITENAQIMTMYVTTANSKFIIKGIDSAEFPMESK